MTEPLTILYVDDDADIRTIVTMALGLDPEIDVRVAYSGAEALEMIAGGLHADVALLDVMMPDMSGLAVSERMRAMPQDTEIPIIFMTARARPSDVNAYLRDGAIGVIMKPFDPLALPGEIRRLLRSR